MRKKTAVILGFLLAADVSFCRAEEVAVSDLQKAGFSIEINGTQISLSSPGQPGSTANANANGHSTANANANGHSTANANANSASCQVPGGTNCYPPAPYPNPGYRQFRFNSGDFTFASDARKAMNNAVDALQKAGYPILEKRDNFNSYTLVFLATNYAGIEQYKSGQFTFLSDTEKAANEAVAAFRSQGMIILEKRTEWTSFTVSYLNPGWH